MCLYNRIVLNPKYKPNKKNGGVIPPVPDERVKYVPIGCGDCMECRKKKAREWQVRMLEDLRENTNGKFIAFTFSNESIQKLVNMKPTKQWPGMKDLEGYELDNEIATRALRLFNERWRKKYGRALRHWFVTELGQEGTENIHLHGIVWTDKTMDEIREVWGYGHMWPRPGCKKKNYVNEQTVNYIIKYVTKKDEDHKTYKSVILSSDGIGKSYTKRKDAERNKFKGQDTQEGYRTRTGHKVNMPIYWRNKIYSDEEREKLWIQKLDKQERWICGEKIDISKNEDEYWRTLKHYREINKQLGYGTGEKDWSREQYEKERRGLMMAKRLEQKKQIFLKGESSTNENEE